MNILIYSYYSSYSNCSVGGAEVSLRLIAEKFVEIGENISYLSFEGSVFPQLKCRIINGVKVYFLSPLRWPTFGFIWLLNIKDTFIRFQFRLLIYYLIRKERIEIIHTYREYPETYDVLKLRKRHNLSYKVVIRIAGLSYKQSLYSDKLRERIHWTLNSVDILNLLSIEFRELYHKELKKDRIKINVKEYVLDIGISDKFFASTFILKKNSRFKTVMVARFTNYQKRQDVLIEAYKLLDPNSFELHFIGVGSTRNKYLNIVKKYNLDNSVFFHNQLSQEELMQFLKSCNLFCMATDYEGVPKSLLEAMMIGIPTLSSDVVPVNSYIKEGYNGFLCKNDPISWSQKIYELSTDFDKLQSVINRAKEYVSINYDANKNIYKYYKLFASLMNSNSLSPSKTSAKTQ